MIDRLTSTSVTLAAAAFALVSGFCFSSALQAKQEEPDPSKPVSFYRQIRPILQAQCYGCHQPSKAKGDYIMTDFATLLKGGEEGEAVLGGNPEASLLVKEITPDASGKASMPQKADALHTTQIDLIKRWIAEGAKDDTPPSARRQHDMENPPVYATAPLVTSLDYSPDGKYLAVAGYHEVLLHRADGSGLEARLVGLSERIQKIRFSPDGKHLAVAGGNPGRMGEIQVWDVADRELLQSTSTTFDTLYGVSWSPDGGRLAFGAADNSLRVIDAKSGKEVLFNGSANDWVLDSVWSSDGSHLVATSRDMAAKLTEVATSRFVDNITSITPGALRGGIHAVERHPQRDEILIGGSDGLPQIYRIHRQTKRVIGDNANLVRKFPAMEGRIFGVDYSPDGKTIAAASAYHASGAVNIYGAEFDSALSDELKKIHEKRVSDHTPAEKATLEASLNDGVKLLKSVVVADSGIYAVGFSPDGKTLAAGGADGKIRLIDVGTGEVSKEFISVPLTDAATIAKDTSDQIERAARDKAMEAEVLSPNRQVAKLEVMPKEIALGKPAEYAQLLVTAIMKDGTRADVTRIAAMEAQGVQVEITPHRLVRPKAEGRGIIKIRLASQLVEVPVSVGGLQEAYEPDYIRDINPVLSKLGCNMGTCHGGQAGKNGFQLSLRGYDMAYDVTALTEELWSRRSNVAAPARSLMLLKASGAVPHEGGQLTVPGELYYEMIKAWIANGSKIKEDTPKVTRLEVFPLNPVVEAIGEKQQMRVLATYADGITKDVTAEAFIESGNTEVAETDKHGLVTTLRRGEAPMLARFEGAYAATTVTVMGDRSGFAWKEPEKWSRIDELVSSKWQRMKILPSGLTKDNEFLRRVYLDLTGLPPTADEVRAFLEDKTDTRLKRDKVIDQLIASEAFVEQWTNKWADMLQVNSKFLGEEGAQLFRGWIREQIAGNRPYDQFVKEILTASGSNREHPAASYYKILRTPEDTMENTTHLFLAVRFNCNKCHDHPFERWTQGQYYETAAFFSQVGLTKDPASGNRNIGGSAVEGAKPLFEIVQDTGKGEMVHQRTNKETKPEFPYPVKLNLAEKPDASRRARLADWMTSPDNTYFAMSYANRIWGYLTGTGVIEPLDDIRAGNPPSNPELLSYLTDEFIQSGFDVRHLMRVITKSRTYQLSIATNEWNKDDQINYSHAKARRLPAEALYDAIHAVTGAANNIPGVKPGTRAAEIDDAQIKIADGFLGNFGRPVRESACECERSNDVQLGPVMALISGPTVGDAISSPTNAIAELTKKMPDDRRLIEELFVRILNRPPTEEEIKAAEASMAEIAGENASMMKDWAEYEMKMSGVIAAQEAERAEKIAKARQAIADHQKAVAPELAKKQAERATRIAKAEEQVKKSEEAVLPKLADWSAYLDLSTEWIPLDLEVVRVSGVEKLVKEADGSLLATALPPGAAVQAMYVLRAKTSLTGITGIKIEALPDERLPDNGPGLAPDGNFVLTEFTVSHQAAGQAKPEAVKMRPHLASFEQKDFGIAASVNGNNDVADKGWAVSPRGSRRHEAIFETDPAAIGSKDGVLNLVLQQGYQRQRYHLGKFRIYVTSSAQPLRFGASQGLAQIATTEMGKRDEAQLAKLRAEYLLTDAAHQDAKRALVAARMPLPVDQQLLALQGKLVEAQQPVVLDPKLVQLRRDAGLSRQQMSTMRLTAAQDLAWALINSPAFLFNY
ncbi:DUF1549 domain-containing protein [Phragmitibacter flavus]|uniref:DUF1549 domain-containing protein n=1 Tax=Phragmitibacter flavus TaxID=2576071 RepID=A0A5R8KIJ6_9BACT|nr:DUF1549 domain-containing protein [Phragmitibacter flavus]TLD72138.1 DUF1549 domain-containing protein [Phragmitibacter flavus]